MSKSGHSFEKWNNFFSHCQHLPNFDASKYLQWNRCTWNGNSYPPWVPTIMVSHQGHKRHLVQISWVLIGPSTIDIQLLQSWLANTMPFERWTYLTEIWACIGFQKCYDMHDDTMAKNIVLTCDIQLHAYMLCHVFIPLRSGLSWMPK